MEDYIAEANTSEDVVENVVAGTEEQSPFVDDNSAQFEQGYEDVVQSEEVPETSNVDWQGESKNTNHFVSMVCKTVLICHSPEPSAKRYRYQSLLQVV